jgi:Tol biopolymer transport system component
MMQSRLDALDNATPFAPSSRSDAYPSFSSNGESVAFVSDRSGQQEVWVVRSDGSEATRVTENSKPHGKVDWSPDGKFLVYESGKYTPSAAEIAPVAGGPPARIAVGNQLATDPVWSRDGKYVYYTSGLQLFRSQPDGRAPLMLIDGQSFVAAGESPDGRNLYFRAIFLLNQLFRIPRDGGKAEVVEEDLGGRTAAVTKSAVYFIKDRDQALYRLPFAGGPAKRLGVLPVPNEGASIILSMLGFTVSPDDTRIIWAMRDPQIDLEMVRDFQ